MTSEVVPTPRAVVGGRTSLRPGYVVKRLVLYALAIGASVIFMLPFLWTIGTSFKPIDELYTFPPTFMPENPRWENYRDVFTLAPFARFMLNSVIVTLLSVVGQTLSAAAVAFGFSRFRFPGRNILFGLVLATMMLPHIVTLIPTFLIFKYLGWLNTWLPLIVPYWLGGSAFSIFLSRQFFMGIPYELDEAARVDGASNYRIYGSILLPLAMPLVGSLAIFSVLNHWNDFMGPLIYLNSMEMRTLALGLRSFQGSFAANFNYMMAAATATAIPVIVLFFAAQRFFMKGVVMTGMAGR